MRYMITACLLFAVVPVLAGETLADRLCAGFDSVTSLSCQSRKTVSMGGDTVTMLSHVYFQHPARLHVENVSPLKRLIVADGSTFYLHHRGKTKGFSRPLDRLDPVWRMMVDAVAATPLEHILRLRGLAEQELPPAAALPVRRGYTIATNIFVVLNCDATGRLARIEYFASPAAQNKTVSVDYANFVAVSSNCWLSLLQKTIATVGTNTVVETRRFDNIEFNRPIDPQFFNPKGYFAGVKFVDDLSKME